MEPFLGAWGGRYLHRVYVRAFVYRLFTTVYILYFSARIGRRSSRLRQPRRRARRRRCPPPSPTARGHETLVAARSGAMLVSFSLPCPLSPSLRFARGSKSVVCIPRPAGTRRQTRAAQEGQSRRPYDTQTCTMLTEANTYLTHARTAVLRASPPDKQDPAGQNRKGPEGREYSCVFLRRGLTNMDVMDVNP